MAAPIFIGDPVTAVGYRLAGALIRTPRIEDAADSLDAAIAELPPLIVLTSAFAHAVPGERLEEALAAFAPPVLIVPDASGRAGVPDWGKDIRQRIMAE